MGRIALISTDDDFLQGEDLEIDAINDYLNQVGISSDILVWHEGNDWASYDALIFRSPWDYPERIDEFQDWLDDVSSVTRILNPAPLVRWNLNKRYLLDLMERGVRCTESAYCTSLAECRRAIEELGSASYVIKPDVSVGSRNTGLFTQDYFASATELSREILQLGKTVLVQRAIDGVQLGAERGLLFFGGEFSHAIRKGPILSLGGGYIGGKYTEDISLADVSEAEIKLGYDALSAIQDVARGKGWGVDAEIPLYARIDVATPSSGDPMLIEAELFEPSIFIEHSAGGLERFATAVRSKLEA